MDEKDFEVVIDIFLNSADMVIEKEDRSDREDVYPRIEVPRLSVVQYLGCGNFKIDSMAKREPVQAGQNWRDVPRPRL